MRDEHQKLTEVKWSRKREGASNAKAEGKLFLRRRVHKGTALKKKNRYLCKTVPIKGELFSQHKDERGAGGVFLYESPKQSKGRGELVDSEQSKTHIVLAYFDKSR